MKKNGLLLKGFKYGLFLFASVLVLGGTSSSYAVPLTGVDVQYSGAAYGGWYTQYTFDADQLAGPHLAFCVESTLYDSDGTYELISVPDRLSIVSKIATEFFYGDNGEAAQRDYQIAIWNILGVKAYNTSITTEFVDRILKGYDSEFNLFKNGSFNFNETYWSGQSVLGSVSHAFAPGGNGQIASQDYLIAAPVPEPGTILLLGLGMIGLGITGRKRLLFKK